MSNEQEISDSQRYLDFLCLREGDTWRVMVRPARGLKRLRPYLDDDWEVGSVSIDFEALDREMARAGANYTKREGKFEMVQVTAHGLPAKVLTKWLHRMLVRHARLASQLKPVG